jgi:molybdopterin molybdotransferase
MKHMTIDRQPITVQAAIESVLQKSGNGEVETVSLLDAEGRYLAEELQADHPVPVFDRVAMDGYAVRSENVRHASFDNTIELKVIDTVGAGSVSRASVSSGEAIRIMTGAPVPSGCDAVVMLEHVSEREQDGEMIVRVNRPVSAGTNIARRGEDTPEGTVLARPGRRISAGEMAMLATFGYSRVRVYQRPVVGIYATGTELVDVDAPLEEGKIRNSNSYMLHSQILRAGGIPKQYGILPDNFELCYQAVDRALREVDFLITTGGAAVGDYDFVPQLLDKLQANVLFNKVAMRPGSVTTVATLDTCREGEGGESSAPQWIFGLSGNPSACYVGFELFARPVLRRYVGSDKPQLLSSTAVLSHDIPTKKRVDRLMRARLDIRGDRIVASTVGIDKSGVASSLIGANGLLFVAGGTQPQEGETVQVLWLDRPYEADEEADFLNVLTETRK